MKFVLNGVEHELTADQVRERLSDVLPARVRHHGVRVDRRLFPVKQAFEVAATVRREEFTTQTACRYFAALGFELVGEVEPREAEPTATPAVGSDPPPTSEWHTESSAESLLVAYLEGEGWSIVSGGDPQTREPGVDLVANRAGESLALHVKGYPSRRYADPSRAAEQKPTPPSTQAGHWYAQAVLAAMRTRSRRPQARAVIALPDVERYRELHAETAGSLRLSGIDVWWIAEDGQVSPT